MCSPRLPSVWRLAVEKPALVGTFPKRMLYWGGGGGEGDRIVLAVRGGSSAILNRSKGSSRRSDVLEVCILEGGAPAATMGRPAPPHAVAPWVMAGSRRVRRLSQSCMSSRERERSRGPAGFDWDGEAMSSRAAFATTCSWNHATGGRDLPYPAPRRWMESAGGVEQG